MRQLLRTGSLKRLFSFGRRSSRTEEEMQLITSPSERETVSSDHKPTWRCFSYEEIYNATDGFHPDNMVGRGGYAEVYRGVLLDGRVIAVKRLTSASTDEQMEKEFLTELGTVGHVRHPNVSALVGCCIAVCGLHLIFHYSARGSVSSNLHDESSAPLPWKLRHKIAVGTARGLHYLHKECPRRIIHRDIKASNILLTENFEPQISDFGLAKWLPSEWTHRAVGPIEGTFGCVSFRVIINKQIFTWDINGEKCFIRCLAPEYFMHGIVDEKTDVFAFGVFLLEVISGKKPVDGYHKSLLSWARPHINDGLIQMLVDPRLGDDYDVGQLKRLAFAASLCIRTSASWRPSMTEVLDLLEDGEISLERWKMPEEKNEEEDFWEFDDLDDDLEDCDTPSSSTSSTDSLYPQQFS